MRNNIRSTNLRFNLEKDLQRKAWEYLQTMDKQEFKSYSHVNQIVEAVERSLKQALPLFLSGLTAGMAQREPQNRASFPAPEESGAEADVDWYFLGE